MHQLRIGSLFSGIGGLELGLEASGLGNVVWQVEIDDWCRSVLARHWPLADRRITDVTTAARSTLAPVDILCGGFPCQDVSGAGKGEGLSGARSGLWYEYMRIVREFNPVGGVVENVASGARRWLPTVRRMLGIAGYRTRALSISAADVGATHLRRRIFVLFLADGDRLRELQPRWLFGEQRERSCDRSFDVADGDGEQLRIESRWQQGEGGPGASESRRKGADVSYPESAGWERLRSPAEPDRSGEAGTAKRHLGRDVDGVSSRLDLAAVRTHRFPFPPGPQGPHEPPRIIQKGEDYARAKRLKAYGNAVVPQCGMVAGIVLKEWIDAELRLMSST